jgi:hypothetical protein
MWDVEDAVPYIMLRAQIIILLRKIMIYLSSRIKTEEFFCRQYAAFMIVKYNKGTTAFLIHSPNISLFVLNYI